MSFGIKAFVHGVKDVVLAVYEADAANIPDAVRKTRDAVADTIHTKPQEEEQDDKKKSSK
jgi:hypothetical protein